MTTSAQSAQPNGRRVGPLALGVTLLVTGAALSYFTLARRWGYYSGIPLDPSQLIPEDRASLTVWWWSENNNLSDSEFTGGNVTG
jgi:hypothetical protein